MKRLPVLALALGAIAAPVASEPAGLGEGVATAKTLMLSGRGEEARTLLEELSARYRDSNDVDFLLGIGAMEAADHDRAIRHFRAILVRQPRAVRVRLELARAFYLDGDYENAYRQLQFARAGNPGRSVVATIDRFLGLIRQQKDWSYNLNFAIAPDSNINSGSSATDVVLFGLPFELSPDTRRQSGVGVVAEGGVEFAPRISDGARLKLAAAVQRREYKGSEFDDMTVVLSAGPRVVRGAWDLSLAGVGFRRWLGRKTLAQGLGAKAETTHHLDARTAVLAGAAAQRIRYPSYPLQSGSAFSAWAGLVRALTPDSSINARLGVSRRTAGAPELASWSGSIATGYYRDLPGGFSIYLEPSLGLARYDAEDPFFGVRRRDRLIEMRFAVLHRRIILSRFTPRISLTWTRRNSSIDLYDFSQRRLEIGVTSRF